MTEQSEQGAEAAGMGRRHIMQNFKAKFVRLDYLLNRDRKSLRASKSLWYPGWDFPQ